MLDLTGRQFGRLTVVQRVANHKAKRFWLCACSCGATKEISATHLQSGDSQSCGCRNKEACRARAFRHGLAGSDEYLMWKRAGVRARRKGILFTISPQDIHIPEFCPVLGLRLQKGVQGLVDSSPSLDRWDNEEGYTPTNIVVISYRANRIKNDATVDELRAILRYMEV